MKIIKLIFINFFIIIFMIIFLEGFFSYYKFNKYGSNSKFIKEKIKYLNKNEINKSERSSIDPYNNQIKSVKRTVANRYTISTNGRYAPNTLARNYEYFEHEKGKGDGLYTDNYGFIHNGEPDRVLFNNDTHDILFIGGSSAEGATTTPANEYTISAFIEKELRLAPGYDKHNIINAAKSGYTSYDEFLTIYNLHGKFDFQEIIFFNGWNDFISNVYTTKNNWNYYQEIVNYNQQNNLINHPFELTTSYYANVIKAKLRNKFNWYKKISRFNQKTPSVYLREFQPTYDTPKIDKEKFDAKVKHSINNYISNLRLLASYCEEFKKYCKFYLQPVYSYKNKKNIYEINYHKEIEFKDYLLLQKKFFDAAKIEFELLEKKYKENKYVKFHDLTNIFFNNEKLVFWDLIHYSRYGNSIIGKSISETITIN